MEHASSPAIRKNLTVDYLLITVVPLGLFSIYLILFPTHAARLVGMNISGMGLIMLQFLGASLAGHAVVNYRSRRGGVETRRMVYQMNITSLSLAVGIGLWATWTKHMPLIGSVILLMHMIFLLGFLVKRHKIT
jgi:hypothetical protein